MDDTPTRPSPDQSDDTGLARSLSWLAGSIAVTIALAGPAGYWVLSLRGESKEAAIAARLHAAFLTQAIGGEAQGWQSRVAGLIDVPLAPGELPERRRIEDLTGRAVGETGPVLATPILEQRTTLSTPEGPVGAVVVARSLRPVAWLTALVALVSALLGGAVFASLRLLPLRALRRTLTKLRQQEVDARHRAEEQLRIVLDNAVESVIVFRPDGALLSLNQSAAALLGYAPAEFTSLQIQQVLRLPSARSSDQGFEVGQFETVMLCKDGQERPVEVGISDMNVPGAAQRIAIVRDITERLAHEARLAHMASYDGLTGLPNRGLFRDRLRQAMARSRRTNRRAALMFIDLDRFKHINDSLGHEVGDQLLVAVAQRLSQCLRETDTLSLKLGREVAMDMFRLGGDEFTVLVEDLGREGDVALVAQRMSDALTKPFQIGANELFISASIGITHHDSGTTDDIESLVKQADMAMYRAKEAGRDGFFFFNEALNADMQQRHKLEGLLRRALERNEYRLHYQPKVSTTDGQVTGVEALLRWQPAGEALVPPDRFIPILEESGLIVPVGAWVIRHSCEQMMAWQRDGMPPLSLAVNLSARQFRQPDLISHIAQVLNETGLPPELLELELTESMLIHDSDAVMRVLHELGGMGVRIAIDDFGTGHSSLSYLKRFDVDTLKIDRAFVRDTPDDADDCAIARAVVALAHGLGLSAVAEGVENARQLEFLAALGCEMAQGYFISRPLPPDAFAVWLAERNAQRAEAGSPKLMG